jgi:hypothetical protein
MHDPADDATIIHSLLATDVSWQVRLYPLPLLVAQPKQILALGPNPKRIDSTLKYQTV